LLVRRFLADYARNPVNLLMLVLVPAAFVAGAAGSLARSPGSGDQLRAAIRAGLTDWGASGRQAPSRREGRTSRLPATEGLYP
jgi:hypothetical protein